MNLRIRVVLLSKQFGVGEEYLYAVQVSADTLNWWTLARFKTFEEALGPAKDLEQFSIKNRLVHPTHVLWKAVL